MKKTAKTFLKKAVKYGAVYGLGAVTVLAAHMLIADPMKEAYVVPVLHEVDTGTHKIDAVTLGKEQVAVMKYMTEWPYIFQRHKAIGLMEKHAALGLVSAMENLSVYYRHKAYKALPDMENFKKNHGKSLCWAREAAKKGSPYALSMQTVYFISAYADLSAEDIATLEAYAKVAQGVSLALYEYYRFGPEGKPRDLEKAEYWKNYEYQQTGRQPSPAEKPLPVLTEERLLYKL